MSNVRKKKPLRSFVYPRDQDSILNAGRWTFDIGPSAFLVSPIELLLAVLALYFV